MRLPGNKIFLCVLMMFSSRPALSQTNNTTNHLKGLQEIDVSYGLMSLTKFGKGIGLSSTYGFPYLDIGPLFATYRYYITDWVNIGITAGNEHFKGDVYNEINRNWTKVGGYTENAMTVAAEAQVLYMRKKYVRLYGGLGIGYTADNKRMSYTQEWKSYTNTYQIDRSPQTDNNGYGAFQVTFFGVRVGNKVGLFAETGIGYKGFLNGGLSAILP